MSQIGEALDLADFKTKKADIDARRASLEQAEDQALRLLCEFLPSQVRSVGPLTGQRR
jgi:hypothetical protein